MSLDYAWRTFFAAVREAVASELPIRRRLEELCVSSIDKVRSDRQLREDIRERVERVYEARTRISQLSEAEVKNALREIVSIYDALATHLYSTGMTKEIGAS